MKTIKLLKRRRLYKASSLSVVIWIAGSYENVFFFPMLKNIQNLQAGQTDCHLLIAACGRNQNTGQACELKQDLVKLPQYFFKQSKKNM